MQHLGCGRRRFISERSWTLQLLQLHSRVSLPQRPVASSSVVKRANGPADKKANKVLDLHREGLSYRLIGRNLGLCKNTVMGIVRRDAR